VRILRQAVAEAQARGTPAAIAVVDRVGNVLTVYQMNGTDPAVKINAGRAVVQPAGLAGLEVPARAAVIAKAITGAYLSSGGNAFSTRTASQIVQENFNPGSVGLEGGPLFGVQFSQLPCSDLSVRFESNSGGTVDPRIGPKRSPLGFSADPGGLPLYQNETLVGGIGVIADGVYAADRTIQGRDSNLDDELIALAGTVGFDAPSDLRADRIAVDGRSLRYADGDTGDLATGPTNAAMINLAAAGSFTPVTGYYNGTGARAGQAFGFGASGIRPDPDNRFGNNRAFVLTTRTGANRFPPRAGTGAGALSAAEVTRILTEALGVALSARGQIRRPLGSHAEVTISVVDTTGEILGLVRTPDAPVFGTDVSLQKARSSMFFSSAAAAADLASVPAPIALEDHFRRAGAYVEDFRAFLGAAALSGQIAFSNRSIGNLARPFFPDGQNGSANGPLSVPFVNWSPFYTGLQVDLVANNLAQHLDFVLRGMLLGTGLDTKPECAGLSRLANGLQIFSGGVPIYRGNLLVGGVGVSGDGIDQDDMIAFLGLDQAARALGTINNASPARRADRLAPRGVNLRYVQCPFAPFLGSDQQNVCQGR
jgi:uncharacterized protein GlcG (DUF336 family)